MTREIAWAAIRDWVEDVYYWKCQDVLDDGENLSPKNQRFVRLHESAPPPVHSASGGARAVGRCWEVHARGDAEAGECARLAEAGCLQRMCGGGGGMRCRVSLNCSPVAEAQQSDSCE